MYAAMQPPFAVAAGAVSTGHSKGGDDVIIYAGTYDDIPLVINVAGRFWMADGLRQRFGDDIFDRVQQGPVTLTATRDDGHTFDWTLTLEARCADAEHEHEG